MENKYTRIYAYTTDKVFEVPWKHRSINGKGLIKIGQTSDITSDERIKRQFQGDVLTLMHNSYTKLLDVEAIDAEFNYFSDKEIHKILREHGCYQIPCTEWFECTLDEIKEAIKFRKNNPYINTTKKKYVCKDTAEKRGYKKDFNVAKIERLKICRPQLILDILQKYPQANSNVKLAKAIITELNITQFAPSTVSVMIGHIVNSLIKSGHINAIEVNKVRVLTLANSTLKIDAANNEPIKVTNLSVPELLSLLLHSEYGYTLNELVETTKMTKSVLHKKLRDKVKVIYVRKKGSQHNGFEVRLFSEYSKIKIPQDEELYNFSDAIAPKDKVELTYKIMKYGLRRCYGKRTMDKVRKLSNITLSDIEIEHIIKSDTILNNKFVVYNGLIYNRKYAPKKTMESQESKKELKERINTLIRERENGITIKEILEIIPKLSKAYCYSILKELKDAHMIYTKGVARKRVGSVYYIHHSNIPGILYEINQKAMSLCINIGMTEKDIIKIIKQYPCISPKKICERLHELFPQYATNSFNTPVAALVRLLYAKKIITNLGSNRSPKWHIVDDKYVWTPKATYDISAVLDYVRKQYTGATIKEIHEKICCTSPVGTLGIYITKSPYFNCIKTYTGGSNFVYRVFAKDQEVHLPVGVIAEGYGL